MPKQGTIPLSQFDRLVRQGADPAALAKDFDVYDDSGNTTGQTGTAGGEWEDAKDVFGLPYHTPDGHGQYDGALGAVNEAISKPIDHVYRGVKQSLLGTVQAALHPIDTMKDTFINRPADNGAAAIAAARRGEWGQAAEKAMEAVPVIGPAARGLADKLGNGDVGEAVGNALGMAVTDGVARTAGGAVSGYLADSPAATWMDILKPSAASRAHAEGIARGLAERKVVTTNPRTDLVRLAQDRASAIDTDTAVASGAPPGGIPAQDLIDGIDKAIQKQYNNVPVKGGLQAVLKDPNGQSLVDALEAFKQTIKDHAPRGYVDPQHALSLRRTWEQIAQRSKLYTQDNPAAVTGARAAQAGADSIRGPLNDLPGVRDLNAEKNFWLNVRSYAQKAPEAEQFTMPGLASTMIKKGVATGVAGALGGKGAAAATMAALLIREATKSPWWQTWGAAQKTRFLELTRTGQFENAANMALGLGETQVLRDGSQH